MNFNYTIFVHLILLFSYCLCEISEGQKEKLLNGFIKYYNSLPNQIYTSNEGILENTQQVDDSNYRIVINIKVSELQNPETTKLLTCTASVLDSDNTVNVLNNRCEERALHGLSENSTQEQVPEPLLEVTEPPKRKPVELDNEIQRMTVDITSGEQFIAIPRDQPAAPCAGCATHVNPDAPGVTDLANLGVRQLDLHEPTIKHTLESVLDVERQVQVVNGVRYILTLSINFDNCADIQTANCASSKICKINILVKPWVKLSSGANYRAILSNNCTEDWQFGDTGEVLPELPTGGDIHTDNHGNESVDQDDNVHAIHNTDLQSQPNKEKVLTDEELKKLQDQIIPNRQSEHTVAYISTPDTLSVNKEHVFKVESNKYNENNIPVTEPEKLEQQSTLLPDKKKAIDELLNFFDFTGYQRTSEIREGTPRPKRSYDDDLQVLSLAEDFRDIKQSIESAKFVYEMAQAMVDYLNEMDIVVKNRVVKNVIKAEEEVENFHRFMYIQAQVTTPCDKVECEPKNAVVLICNGVIDSTKQNRPQILNAFCYNDNKASENRDVVKDIDLDDPVLQSLAKEAVKKIESESNSQYALKINKIVAANTQITSGTLSKLSVIIDSLNCNKDVHWALRTNCTVIEQLGSKICEVIIHERHWLKERKILYSCTERPADMRITKSKALDKNMTVNDPKINEMLQEAIQYLETQSNRINKQKIVNIKSISTQIIAGFLTKIEFVVGYTNCTDNYAKNQFNGCELLKDERLRLCKAQIWDRSWIMDGRQVEVSCDDVINHHEMDKVLKKRSLDVDKDQPDYSDEKNKNITLEKLATESLNKFLHSSSIRQHYKVVKVNRATIQDASGKLTRLEFSISPTDCVVLSNGLPSSSKCNVINPENVSRCHSKILAQVWLKKKQYSVNCNIKDQNLHLDAVQEQDHTDYKYYQLAEESMKKYLRDTNNLIKHKIVRIEKVTTQLVSGLLTTIDFVISPNNASDTIRCNSKILEKHRLETKNINVTCHIQENNINNLMEENLDNSKYMQIAVESLQEYIKANPDSNLIRVTFVDKVIPLAGGITKIQYLASKAEDDDGDTLCYAEFSDEGQSKSHIAVKCHVIGTVVKKTEITADDPNYLQYVQLADESLQKYIQTINSSQSYSIISLESVVVTWNEGVKTSINFTISPVDLDDNDMQGKQCTSEILEQPWLQKKHIDISCNVEKQLYRTKRQVLDSSSKQTLLLSHEYNQSNLIRYSAPGGLLETDSTDPKYKSLAEESLQKYVQDTGNTQKLHLVRVEKVTTQVVAGSLTRIDFVASTGSGQNPIKCHSKIWEQAWLNKKDIEVSCQITNQRQKRQALVGGELNKDPSDPKYRSLAEESLRKYVQDTGSTQKLQLVQVVNVTTQVVAGSLTRIDFVASTGTGQNPIKCHSKIWEQPWLNKKDIEVSCQITNQRQKRQALVGGERNKDPSDPKYRSLAEESLRKYVQDTGSTQKLQLVQVVNVTTQVVAGSLTRIDFVASTGTGQNPIKCHSKIWEQPWLNKKDIEVSCQITNQRQKRQALVGGELNKDPSDPKYRSLAEESLRKYVQDTESTQKLQLVQVVNVTTQVVAGSLTRIDFVASTGTGQNPIKCHSKIWEQPWLNKKDIEVSCQITNQRQKRQALVGGERNKDPSDPKYRSLAEESLRKYVQDTGSTQKLQLVQVVNVTTQVVAGSLTRIDFVASTGTGQNPIKCHSKIWEQPWLNKKDIEVSCQITNQRQKRQALVGGELNKDPSDPKYRSLAEESLRKYVQDTGSTQKLQLVQVVNVTTQVVAGSLTRIDFVASTGTGQNPIKCHSKIWEQPWLNKKDIEVSCQITNQRQKRQALVGGERNKDPSDPKYRSLAEESLRKYVQDTRSTQKLQLVQVVNVTTQVVAGSLTRINFVASTGTGQNPIKCHSKIWEQAWLNKKDIEVSCQITNQRQKRDSLPGGQQYQDPNDPKYRSLAEESLRKYVQDTGSTQKLQLVHVENVTTQVVAGSLTRIDFVASTGTGQNPIKCHSKIWEQPWLDKKDINVSCETNNLSLRKKREVQENIKPVQLRGNVQKDQDSDKQKYKLLAEESLRKFELKSGIHHKVLEVTHVLKQVVSGFKYKIKFYAEPTECPFNVSKVRALRCEPIDGIILYCYAEIWDRPWLKQKNIEVQCKGADDDDFFDYYSDLAPIKSQEPPISHHKKYDKKRKLLAEEATAKYLTTSKIMYIHKVTDIHSVIENIADGIITKLEFSISPTNCLRNETRGSMDECEIKQPLIVFHCYAKIWERPYLNVEKEIKVTCKKLSKLKKHNKRELGVRNVRQIIDDDEEKVDEDTTYYYADRAVQHVNDRADSNNLHKLITIHAVQSSVQMNTHMVKMYIEMAETYCLRHHGDTKLSECEEMDGINHRLCLARLWPSPDDELVVRHVSVVCDDDQDFKSVTGLHIPELLKLSIQDLERSPDNPYKLVHQGEPQIIPTLDSKLPIKLNFIIATTNCSKDVDLTKDPFQCFLQDTIPSKPCYSFIWLSAETRTIRYINAKCRVNFRGRRSLKSANVTSDNLEIQKLVMLSLEKLEMSSLHRYKQRVLQINSHSTKLTSGKVTTIDFDVGYTSCLKYEWVENITSCDFLEHLPRRRCVAQIWERLWINNGKNIDVNCVDDETPLENHIEFESAEMANQLANEALKHIEAKYPHPKKQKIVRIFSLEKQVVAGIHYRMKVEVGLTDCYALSEETNCKLEEDLALNKFCRVNVWVRTWTDHPPNYRVTCDFQEGATHDLYHQVQAEQLFSNFVTTYSPNYVNDYPQIKKRFDIFKKNIKKIHELNVYEKGTARYGVTRFTDLTYEEFSSRYMGLKTSLRNENQVPMKKADIPDIKTPKNFDWRDYDAVTEVKDQGSCGSCWAFSVTGNIEGQWKMQSGQLVSLSEQELVDCDKLDDGCNGGLPDNAYRAIEQLGGLELEKDYPYEAEDYKCLFNKTLAKVQISGAVNITSNETGMAQWLVHNGPISIGINANAMQFYMGGISHPWKMLCNPTNLDHGVLIVGYGVKDYPLFHKTLPYWIVKNSWGKSWGEQGYYRVYRGDGTCGVNQMASSAVI